MSIKSLAAVLLFLAGVLVVSSGAVASGVRMSKIDINFAQTFAITHCPSTDPVEDLCLNVTGVSDQHETGHMEFTRIAMFNPTLFDNNHPTCLPIETSGTLTLPKGTLKIHAPGNVCFTEGVASYDIIIIGGTGAYAGALGSGKIVVPPPETSSTGRELWHLELVRSDRNEHR